MKPNDFKGRIKWMRSYCRAVLHERFGEYKYGGGSAEALWGRFLNAKDSNLITDKDMSALKRCCNRIGVGNLVNRICSYIPEGYLSVEFAEEKIHDFRIVKMTLTATNNFGQRNGFSMKVRMELDKIKRVEFHEGLRAFIRNMVGESSYLSNISRLTTVIRKECERIGEWYYKNVKKKEQSSSKL